MAAGPVPHPRTPVSSSTLSTITLLLVLMFSVNADTDMATDRVQHNGHEPMESHARLDLPSMNLQLSSTTQQQPSKYTSWQTSQSATVNPSKPRRNDEAVHEQIDAMIMPLLQQSHSPSLQPQLQDSQLPSHAQSKPQCTDDVDDFDFEVLDRYGNSCSYYRGHPNLCGTFDSTKFDAHTMCCACGGGSTRSDVQHAHASWVGTLLAEVVAIGYHVLQSFTTLASRRLNEERTEKSLFWAPCACSPQKGHGRPLSAAGVRWCATDDNPQSPFTDAVQSLGLRQPPLGPQHLSSQSSPLGSPQSRISSPDSPHASLDSRGQYGVCENPLYD